MNTGKEQEAWIGRLKLMALTTGLFVLALGVFALLGPGPQQEPLPVLGQVPAFNLVGLDGKAFSSQALQGKIYVASFVFTSCKNSCPMLTLQMQRLSKLLPQGDGFALLSITVDPEKDSPKVLAAYAKRLGIEDPRWIFLTGKKADIKAVVMDGFMISAQLSERVVDERGQPDIPHSPNLLLMDGQNRIRGIYDGLLGSSVGSIQRDIKRLARG